MKAPGEACTVNGPDVQLRRGHLLRLMPYTGGRMVPGPLITNRAVPRPLRSLDLTT